MRRIPRSLVALLLGFVLLVAACGGGEGPSLAKEKTPADPSSLPGSTALPRGEYIAQATVPMVEVYDAPDASTPSHEFENPWYYPTDTEKEFPISSVFYSDDQRDGWVKVLLPVRPNGSSGWVRASDVRLVPSRYRVHVDISEHKLTVYEDDEVLMEDTVAIGEPSTPTPLGRFYIRITVKVPDPTTVYGPYAFGLSSYSDVLEEFNGGEPQVGIHGNNDPSQLGKDVSHGCIRMDNDKITQLAATLPLGTPVDVRA